MTPLESRVYEYLKTHSHITVNECNAVLGTTECRKIISDLKKKIMSDGYTIKDCWVDGVNRYGEKVRFKKYFLEKI